MPETMMKWPRRRRVAVILIGPLCMGLGVTLLWGAVS